jgi:high-affinity iron transporter
MENLFSALVITLREGIEAALAIAIVVLYLRKTGKQHLSSAVWSGLLAAIVASLAGGFLLERLAFSSEIVEGFLMLAAAFFVGTMILWMWRSAKGLKKEIETKMDQITATDEPEHRGGWIALFLFTFLMIVREGIETVIFLSAVNLTTTAILSFFGGITGLVLAILFGVFFVRGSLRIDLGRFFKITGIVLLIFVFQLLIGGVHELAEGGLIDIGPRAMALIGPLVKNNALFLIGMLLIPVLMLLIPGKGRGPSKDVSASKAEQRLEFSREKKQRTWRTAAAVLATCIVLFIAYDFVYSQNRALTPPVEVSAQGQEVRIPVQSISDGKLHRFVLAGTPIRFIVLKIGEGRIATAFDACEICGSQGYVQEGGALICLNCSADINTATIGQSGGCNPILLSSKMEGGTLTIPVEVLKLEESRFMTSTQHAHH